MSLRKPKNSKLKAPSFQFYPNDWLNDVVLQSCSDSARAAMVNLMCVMHECEPYGYLAFGDVPMDTETIIRVSKIATRNARRSLAELTSKGVLKVDAKGRLHCERMVRDFGLRKARSHAGSQGGNPDLLNHLLKQTDKQTDKQILTPSFSFSKKEKKELKKKKNLSSLLVREGAREKNTVASLPSPSSESITSKDQKKAAAIEEKYPYITPEHSMFAGNWWELNIKEKILLTLVDMGYQIMEIEIESFGLWLKQAIMASGLSFRSESDLKLIEAELPIIREKYKTHKPHNPKITFSRWLNNLANPSKKK